MPGLSTADVPLRRSAMSTSIPGQLLAMTVKPRSEYRSTQRSQLFPVRKSQWIKTMLSGGLTAWSVMGSPCLGSGERDVARHEGRGLDQGRVDGHGGDQVVLIRPPSMT